MKLLDLSRALGGNGQSSFRWGQGFVKRDHECIFAEHDGDRFGAMSSGFVLKRANCTGNLLGQRSCLLIVSFAAIQGGSGSIHVSWSSVARLQTRQTKKADVAKIR